MTSERLAVIRTLLAEFDGCGIAQCSNPACLALELLDYIDAEAADPGGAGDEVAARTLRGVAFESIRRGIAKSVAAVGDGRVSSLRYCVPAIQEFERGRIHAGIGAAPRPVAVPDPDPEPDVDGAEQLPVDGAEYSDRDKTPIFAAAALFVRQFAALNGEQPPRDELRRHLLEVCFERGHDPGLVDAIYPAATLSVDSALSAIGAATAAEE